MNVQASLDLGSELVIDLFAGGGGASEGIEQGLGRPVDIAVNHDPLALAMHRANHPRTLHLPHDVFEVDPVAVTHNRPVGLLWASPDCTHHSKAKGSKPKSQKIRGLAWVVVKWARRVRPRAIMLENVEEFEDWGPLDKDGRPDKTRKGQQFQEWVNQLRRIGYAVEWRMLRASNYDTPTIRRRLYLIARCDGLPIVWPKPTHGLDGLPPVHTAAEIIDWSIACRSIFDRKKPLVDNTLRRIARGVVRFVLEDPHPFIVGAGGPVYSGKPRSVAEPFGTILKENHSHIVVPTLVQTGYGERPGQAPRVPGLHKPLGTIVGTQKHALVAAFLAKHYGGNYKGAGASVRGPVHTVTAQDHHAVVAAHLLSHHGTSRRHQDMRNPAATVCAGGTHASLVAAMLAPYYGSGSGLTGRDLREPAPTITSKDRLQLVTVTIEGESFILADIGMRMLQPHELFRAQGFRDDYIIRYGIDDEGQHVLLTKGEQVRMCGNSVCPPVARAIVEANFRHEERFMEKAA